MISIPVRKLPAEAPSIRASSPFSVSVEKAERAEADGAAHPGMNHNSREPANRVKNSRQRKAAAFP